MDENWTTYVNWLFKANLSYDLSAQVASKGQKFENKAKNGHLRINFLGLRDPITLAPCTLRVWKFDQTCRLKFQGGVYFMKKVPRVPARLWKWRKWVIPPAHLKWPPRPADFGALGARWKIAQMTWNRLCSQDLYQIKEWQLAPGATKIFARPTNHHYQFQNQFQKTSCTLKSSSFTAAGFC